MINGENSQTSDSTLEQAANCHLESNLGMSKGHAIQGLSGDHPSPLMVASATRCIVL